MSPDVWTAPELPGSRRELETSLAAVVREHRFTIAVVFPVVGAVLLIASADGLLPAPFAFHAGLLLVGVAVMRSPLLVGLLPIVNRRVIGWLAVLAGYTYLIEFVGVQTDWPYGAFSYGIALGPMVGSIPLALPLLFIPLVLNAYLLWLLLLEGRAGRLGRVFLVIPTVVLMDVVLDPAAVALGFWAFDGGGVFYGVPLSNYAGWVLSATVATLLVERAFDPIAVRRRIRECSFVLDDLVSFVILWTAINAWFANGFPVGGALLLAAGVVVALRRRSRLSPR